MSAEAVVVVAGGGLEGGAMETGVGGGASGWTFGCGMSTVEVVLVAGRIGSETADSAFITALSLGLISAAGIVVVASSNEVDFDASTSSVEPDKLAGSNSAGAAWRSAVVSTVDVSKGSLATTTRASLFSDGCCGLMPVSASSWLLSLGSTGIFNVYD